MNRNPLHSVSVAGVTFNDLGQVLLIKRRDNGQWQAPGGVLELNETFEQGLVREVREESGIEVRVDRLTGVYKNMVKGVVALVYRCGAIGGAPRVTDETAAIQWIDLVEALTRMTPAFAVRVQDAARPESSLPASRAHDGVNLI